MSTPHFSLKFPTRNQVNLWSIRRDQSIAPAEIARQKKISRAAVTQALKEADERIESLLENAALMNKIRLERLDSALGFAVGYSVIFKVKTYITYSPINGVKVWYEHKGNCEGCEEFGECRRAIHQEFKERKLQVPNEQMRPTDLGEILFHKLEGMLE